MIHTFVPSSLPIRRPFLLSSGNEPQVAVYSCGSFLYFSEWKGKIDGQIGKSRERTSRKLWKWRHTPAPLGPEVAMHFEKLSKPACCRISQEHCLPNGSSCFAVFSRHNDVNKPFGTGLEGSLWVPFCEPIVLSHFSDEKTSGKWSIRMFDSEKKLNELYQIYRKKTLYILSGCWFSKLYLLIGNKFAGLLYKSKQNKWMLENILVKRIFFMLLTLSALNF